MKHLHFDVLAYVSKEPIDTPDNVRFNETVVVTVIAKDEEEAMRNAKKLVKRNFYYLQKVYECKTCMIQEKNQKLLREYIELAKHK